MFNWLSRLLHRRNGGITANFLDYAEERTRYTPDQPELDKHTHQYLFVYDHMMERHPQNYHLGGNARKCVCWTKNKYSMWQVGNRLNSRVIPLKDKFQTAPYAAIKGELYLLPNYIIQNLDREKENTVKYNRVKTHIIIPHRGIHDISDWGEMKGVKDVHYAGNLENKMMTSALRIDTLKVWMYTGDNTFWNSQLDGGYLFTPVKTFVPNTSFEGIDRYYYLQYLESECPF